MHTDVSGWVERKGRKCPWYGMVYVGVIEKGGKETDKWGRERCRGDGVALRGLKRENGKCTDA